MKVNVGIVTFPLHRASRLPILNLATLFSKLANRVYLISGGPGLENLDLPRNVYVTKVIHKVSSNVFIRIISYMKTEIEISRFTIAATKRVNLLVFFVGGESLVLPMLATKLLRKKVVLMPGGMATKGYLVRKDPLTKFLQALVTFNMNLVDRLIVYSPYLINEEKWRGYQHMTLFAHEHFVDFTQFDVTKKIGDRRNIVGYVGRLSKEKGVLNLTKAIPFVLKEKDSHFVICGKGNLTYEIENFVEAKGLEDRVKLRGWIPHQDLPRYLNKMRLLVLPSFTEGLPNVILEAMACGTPVLATPVGAIPDIIKDGETGFLLQFNDPKHMAQRIIELLDKPNLLEKVSVNACRYVRENFSYEKTLEAWRKIFSELELY